MAWWAIAARTGSGRGRLRGHARFAHRSTERREARGIVSDLAGARVLEVHSGHIPPAGGFLFDLSLDATALPALALATLTIGDLALVGTVTSAAFDDHPAGGARPRVLLEGGAGWGKLLARKGAYGGGPLRLSVVLRDLAALAGEFYDAPPDKLLPQDYGWPAATKANPVRGRHVLADLQARGAIPTWRVDPATGRTRFDPWPSTGPADATGRVMRRNLTMGRRTVGLDSRVGAWLPGATVEGVAIRRLRLRQTGSMLEIEVYER